MNYMYSPFDKSVPHMSSIIVKKRERTQNWAPEEKNVLLSLIKPQIHAIENKKIDAAASAMKTQAWHQIHNAFKGRFSTDRDITRIKEQWRRMKTQSKSEMVTFAERVRIDPEEATKCRPSTLSLEVWRLLENVRKSECEGGHSDESNEDIGSASLMNLLDRYAIIPPTSETGLQEIKQEGFSDSYSENDSHFDNKCTEYQRKRNSEENNCDKTPQTEKKRKSNDIENQDNQIRNEQMPEGDSADIEEDAASELSRDFNREVEEDGVHSSLFMLAAAQKEHRLKVHMLEIEIQRAELQKQAAFNDLKASEVKRELIESQANDYYNQVRMSGERGSGAGKGGGGGGSIREAGGAFGKMEAAKEDQYFYNLQKEQIKQLKEHLQEEIVTQEKQKDQLKKLKDSLHDEIAFHEEQIKRHQEAIKRHKDHIGEIEKQ